MFFAIRFVLAAAILAGTAFALSTTGTANAQGSEIEAAKAAGVIGERVDGYLGIVNDGGTDASLIRRINEINAKRRAVYDELAREASATPAQVARLTGEKQIARAAPGEYYLNEQGVWVQKGVGGQ